MLRIFIGWDARESIAWQVCAHSILARASRPVALIPLTLAGLAGLYTRPRGPEATDFSYTRFLVPYLSGYEGLSLYLDCDILCRIDVAELEALEVQTGPGRRWQVPAVWVAQHDYVPRTALKMDGQVQVAYPRKNWSSVIAFNNVRCTQLTPDYVNRASGADLHRFAWLPDAAIGALPLEYNWLVDEYPPNPAAKLLHYTLGGPWFKQTRDCDHAADWLAERAAMDGGA